MILTFVFRLNGCFVLGKELVFQEVSEILNIIVSQKTTVVVAILLH